MPRVHSSINKLVLLLLVTLLSAAVLYSKSAKPKLPVATKSKSTFSPAQFSISTTFSVPVVGKLRMRKVPAQVVAAQIRASGDRTPVLNEVIRQAPGYFPHNARVLQVSHDGNHFLINVNRAFANPNFWRGRTRQSTKLAFHALARNVAFINEGKGTALPVQFVVEGRKVSRIGSFRSDRALRPKEIIGVSK